jgi:protein-S-isoprenylcysteine O-methyltransferase Ste14
VLSASENLRSKRLLQQRDLAKKLLKVQIMVTIIVLIFMVSFTFKFSYEKPLSDNCSYGSNLRVWFIVNSVIVIILTCLRLKAFLNVSQKSVVSRTASKRQMR